MKADLVILNGRIYTMDPEQPMVEAVAMASGWVMACGDTETVRACVGPHTTVLDLAGKTALPGLTDAHLHFAAYGLALQHVDLTGVRSAGEAAERVRARAAQTPAGQWIEGRGWDRNLWTPPDFPTRELLDVAAPRHPVALSSKDCHALWANSLALHRLGINASGVDPTGGQIRRDPRTGEPTGILLEDAAAMALERMGPPDPQALRQAILVAAAHAHRVGLTGVHDCEGGNEMAAMMALWSERALPLRVYMLIPRDGLDAAVRLGLRSGFGDAWLRVGHLKLFADGALGSHTADLYEPYEGEPGNCGVTVLDDEALHRLVERAAQAGIAPATHAIGDRANRRVLDAYQATRDLWQGQGLRPRIEHAQLLQRQDIPRFAQLGVIASMQPIHATSDMDMAEAYWGRRCEGAYAWKSLLAAGAVLAFGSDCPVESLDPLAGIYAAVTRQRPGGAPAGGWRAAERLSVYEAVRAYTWGAAYAAGEERIKGSLGVGKVADLVVLSQDIFHVPPEALLDTRVQYTICGGQVVYSDSMG